MVQLLSSVPSVSVKIDLIVMEFEDTTTMRHSEKGYFKFFRLVIELSFNVHTDCTCALIQNSEHGFMIEEPCHSDSLFLPS